MYTVYSEDDGVRTLIHDGASPDMGVRLISPRLTLGDCTAGTFEATIPPGNVGYSKVEKITSTIIVKKDNDIIWTGRVISESKDFYNQRKITAEGALAFLNDSNQGLRYFKNTDLLHFVSNLITHHNSKANVRQVALGSVDAQDPEHKTTWETSYGSTWEEFNSQCLEPLGGHVRIRYSGDDITPILDYLGEYPNRSPQEINFGSNLLDFTINWDVSNLATVIIPKGKELDEPNANGQKEYVTVTRVNGGKNYVANYEALANFGRIEKVVEFSDVDNEDTLLEYAEDYANAMQFDEMALSVSAVDLHYLTNTETSFELLDEVLCISHPHGLKAWFPITEIDIPLDDPAGISYTMGSVNYGTMSGNTVASNNKVAKSFRSIMPTASILDLAKQNATEILNRKTTGYVTITEVSEKSQALIISSTPNWENSQKYWKFDMNGLGYTKNGGTKYDLAITMDGTIVADFIKTGVLSDGRGYNYWNLSTGEFSLGQTSKLMDDSGKQVYINDVVNLARDTADRRTGSQNYLSGSSTWTKWRHAGGWTFDKKFASCSAKSSVTNKDSIAIPKKSLLYSKVKGYKLCLSFEGVNSNKSDAWGDMSKNNAVIVQFRLMNSSFTSELARVSRLFSLSTKWVRKYTVIDMLDQAFTNISDGEGGGAASGDGMVDGDGADGAGGSSGGTSYDNGYLDIRIINKSKHAISIRHVKLERGTTPTDWNESEEDIEDFSYATAEEAKNAAKKYAYNQKKALDESLNQEGVLRRLTNNYASKGIWLTNGELYINGSYVRTGTLDAGIIKAGILRDKVGRNQWNMVTGYLETSNAVFRNALVTGNFQSGTYNKIVIEDGKIIGKRNNRNIGYIEPTAVSTYIPSNAQWDGLQIQCKDLLRISAPHIAVKDSRNVSDTAITGVTTNKEITFIKNVEDLGNGQIRYTSGVLYIECINGIVTALQVK